jgi:hypothetical protein
VVRERARRQRVAHRVRGLRKRSIAEALGALTTR